MRSAPELLAPAGGPDAAYAALHYGADAIYCGLPRFSARADAENFTLQQLGEAVAFAHAQTPRRRVYVTVNTLVLQSELPALIETLAALSGLGVDALIVQDLGVAAVVREHFPELRLHASTQLAIHNRAGAAAARDFGFKRVTLARELTLDELRDISALPGIETEAFIHGALCYSYSGLCLFSSQMLGLSGNRGRCAQPCRLLYQVQDGPAAATQAGYACSMKDLALPDYVGPLRDAGVSSFKIEGRKKNALYVAAVTSFYRGLLDGTLSGAERAARAADIQTIFSRPWTSLSIGSPRQRAVADADAPSHRGTPVGVVEAVVRAKAGAFWLHFRSARALEHYDGLQVEVPGPGKPFGFSVERLRIVDQPPSGAPQRRQARASRVGSRDVFTAPAGARVAVQLPAEGFPTLPLGAPVCCSSSQDVKRRYRFPKPKPRQFSVRQTVDVTVEASAHAVRVTGRVAAQSAGAQNVEAHAALKGSFPPAKDARDQATAARGAFEQLGDTNLALGRLDFRNPDGVFVPVSQWKQLRRAFAARMGEAFAAAQAERVARVSKACDIAGHQKARTSNAGKSASGAAESFLWSIKVDRLSFLSAFDDADWAGLDELVIGIARDPLPELAAGLDALARRIGRERIRLALPIITRAWEDEELRGRIEALRSSGWRAWQAANLSAWTYLPARLDVDADWPVHVLNVAAARAVLNAAALRVTLSPEDGLANYRALLAELGPRATVVVYQDTPLFISETCAYANLRGACAGPARCTRPLLSLVSAYGDRLLAVTERCRNVFLNQRPFCLAGRWRELRDAGAARLRADFVTRPYTAEEVRALWRQLRSGAAPAASHVANFDRGLL